MFFRCDVYDLIESILNIDNVIFVLGNFVVFFVVNMGLVVGKVIRIVRILKVFIFFFVFKLEKEIMKLFGVVEIVVLEYKGVENGFRNLVLVFYIESKIYIWCNGRECVCVLKGEEMDSKF